MLDIVLSFSPVQYQGKQMMQTSKNLISDPILHPQSFFREF